MAADSGIPDKFSVAIRLGVFWISLPFIFFLVAVERAIENHIYQTATCSIFGVLSIVIAFYWEKLIPPRLRSKMESPENNSEALRFMTAYEVVHYMADESRWGETVRNYADNGIKKVVLLEAPVEFKRIAELGKIQAIGRLNNVGSHVEIPNIFWMSSILNWAVLGNRHLSETMPAVPNPIGIPIYTDVRIPKFEVELAWPRRLA